MSNGQKGRGAQSKKTGRFEPYEAVSFEDGWKTPEVSSIKTTFHEDQSRKVVTRNRSPDVPFERSINPYRGCEHGCIYCYARPSHTYLGFSAGLDFETEILVKRRAPALLARELRSGGYRCRTIALGSNTDPYQPIEKRTRIVRQILEILYAHNHPVCITTKSTLILRDLDILSLLAGAGLVRVNISLTTLDAALANKMEPRAATPQLRLKVISQLQRAGIPTGVLVAPLVPGLTDHELERILERGAAAGAGMAGYIWLRLPLEVKDLFLEWLGGHFPEKQKRIMHLVRSVQNGLDYDPRFGQRMTGGGKYAFMVRDRFQLALRRLGLQPFDLDLDETKFSSVANGGRQLTLFSKND